MKVADQIQSANRELSGPLAVAPSFQQELAFRRLQKLGWQFVDEDPGVVLVLKHKGEKWHRVTDSACDKLCDGWKFRGKCSHHDAVYALGGVDRVKALIQKYQEVYGAD